MRDVQRKIGGGAVRWCAVILFGLGGMAGGLAAQGVTASPQQPGPGDSALTTLSQPDAPDTAYLKAHPGAKALTHGQGKLLFQNANGSRAAVLGPVTHQDPTSGAWVANAPVLSQTGNGWRVDGTANNVLIRSSGTASHTITQTYTDYATKHASVLSLTIPALTYDKAFGYHFTMGGLTWNLAFNASGTFAFSTAVAKRQGPKTYTFPVSGSGTMAVNASGQLASDSKTGLTPAVMIPKTGKRVACSAWTYSSSGAASFSCDDSAFKDNQLPYKIDPTSITLDDPTDGSYNVDSWAGLVPFDNADGDAYANGSDSADVYFNTAGVVPSNGTLVSADCGFNTDSYTGSSDDQVTCGLNPAFNNSGTTDVQIGIDANDWSNCNCSLDYSDSATVSGVTLTVTYTAPPMPVTLVSPSNGAAFAAGTSSVNLSWAGASDVTSYSLYFGASNPPPAYRIGGYAFITSETVGANPGNTYYWYVQAVNAYGSTSSPTWHFTVAAPQYTATPTFSLAGGTYASGQSVTIGTTTQGATIRYTTNGSTPSESAGTVYTGAIPVGNSMTIKAIAYKSGYADSAVASATYTITPAITGPASLPVGTASAAYPSITATATAGTGSYTWSATGLPAGLSIGAATGTISGTPTSSSGSPYSVVVTVTDSNSVTANKSYTLTVNPALTVSGPASLAAGAVSEAYAAITVTATGGSGSYTWSATGLPAGVIIASGTGVISGTPTTNSGSPFSVAVTARDGNSVTASKSYTLTVNPALAISGPASLVAGAVNETYPATTETATGGVGSYTWSATGLPAGVSIAASTGVISGTPATNSGSPFSVVVTARDSNSVTASKSYTLTVNGPLAFSGPASLPVGTVNAAYASTTETATGGAGSYTWSATGLPAGLSIAAGTGIVSGAPATNSGSPFSVVVTVTDSALATASKSYSLTVNQALAISGPASLAAGAVSEAYAATTVTATGGSGSYTWSAAGLPAGLSLGAASGTISGTPTSNTGSPFTVQVTVTDSNSVAASKSYSLTINGSLTVSGPSSLPPGAVNETYTATTETATGGMGSYTWSATGLPAGLSIAASTGIISGTPATNSGSPYSVAVTATDSNSATATRSYTLTVNGALTISGPASLPVGTVNATYAATTETATGGTGSYAWSAAGLPAGLSIASSTGVISGTPTSGVGSPFAVVVTVTDGNSKTATASYTLTIVQGAYGHYRAITISHSKVPNTDQTNFPVAISGTYSYLATVANGGAVQNANAYDIIFSSDAAGTNPLSFEREKYVATTGEVDFWVRIPTLSHTADTTIYMWYGNPSVVTDQAAAAQVWDSYFKGVWHFANGATSPGNDSTSNGNNGTPVNSPAAAAGQIDGAAGFNGSSSYISYANSSSLNFGAGSFTVSLWMNGNAPQSGGNYPAVIQKSVSDLTWLASSVGWMIWWDNSSSTYRVSISGGSGIDLTAFSGVANDGTWKQVAVTITPTQILPYVNGVALAPYNRVHSGATDTSATMNMGWWSTYSRYWNGLLDEVHISNVARSADWIATEYNNQSSPAAFYTIGAAGVPGQGTVSTPTFSVAGGNYTSTQTVGISTTTSGSTIRYTIDGSTPSETNGTVYSGPVTVASSLTLKAIAYQNGWNDSLVASATYIIAVTPPTVIASSPTGQQVTVDGASYATPQTFTWAAGSQHTIAAPAAISGTGMQGAFAGWSDGGAAAHSITVGAAGATYTASYTTQYYLTTAAAGPGTVAPSSNWYAAGAQVTVTATPNAGSQFQGFTGTTASSANPLTVTMNGPVTETAQFATAPSFAMTVTAASPYPVTAGASASYTVAVTPLNGFSGAVGLVASGQPAGASVSFNPPTVTVAGTTAVTSAMTVTTWASGPAGTSTLTVTATGGGVTQSGSATLTVGPPPVFSIAPLPAQNPYGSGWQIVQQGAPMVYTVLPPAGYTGWIQLSSVGVGCVISAPVFGVSGWGTGNADGSLTVTITQDPVAFPASGCAQQSLKTYGNKIYLNLAIAVYGANPPVNQQTFNMPLEVTTVPAISLGVSLLSQTGGAATYLATVSTTSYGGVVNLGLQAGSCAKLMGAQPTVSLPTQPMAKIWVLTAGCAPGTNTTLTFTAGNATVQADPQTVTLQTAPAAAVIRSPAPGATIPGGATTFNWNTVTGATGYCLYAGTAQQATCSGTAQPGAQVTLPLSGVVYATLGTQVGGVWQYQQSVYTVNPNPAMTPLVVRETTVVPVPNNGAGVRRTYYFTEGDPTTIGSVSTGVNGLTARVVSATRPTATTTGTATLEFVANGSAPAGTHSLLTAYALGGYDEGGWDGPPVGPDLEPLSVEPYWGTVGQQFTISDNGDLAMYLFAWPGDLSICNTSQNSCEDFTIGYGEESVGFTFYYTPQNAGDYVATAVINNYDDEFDLEATPPTTFHVTAAGPSITSASPNYILAGSSGSIQIQGQNLDQQPQVSIGSSGVTVAIASTAANQVTVSYQADADAATGPASLTVTTAYGSASTGVDVIPTVTITGDIGIPLGGSTDYDVELSSDSGGGPVSAIRGARASSVSGAEPIQLKIVTTPGGGTATFADGTTTMTITSSQTVTVQGVTPSSQAGDVQLVAVPAADPGVLLAWQSVSTVAVAITMRNSDPLSPGDSAAGFWNANYPNSIGPNRLGKMVISWCGIGTEFAGQVTPANYKGTVTLRRYNVGGSDYYGSVFLKAIGGNDDTSAGPLRDNDPQFPGANGNVYDLDAPGISADSVYVYRMRDNFEEYAVLGAVDGTSPADERQGKRRVSPVFPWWARVSCMGNTSNQLAFNNDFAGDNQVGAGTTNTNYNFR